MPRPADQAGHTESPLPVGVLLASKWGRAGVRPGVLVRPVVGGVENDGILGDPEVVHSLQDFADRRIMLDHAVGVFRS